ncbi:MAG: pyrimidine 5'-nucleotidase [Alphaproteobacteria bacterium]
MTINTNKNKKDLAEIETWIFDLDDTLYSASTTLFEQIEIRIREYISTYFKINDSEAFELQKGYYQKYGTTLRGLILEKGMEPDDYMEKVHDLDLTVLSPNPNLDKALSKINGKKYVFTNGPKEHAERVTAKIGIRHHFAGFFGAREGDLIPKPELVTYQKMLKTYNIDPKKAALFEDSQRNLKPAHDLGITTIWVRNLTDKLTPVDKSPEYCDFITDDLVAWLEENI